ncbi:MAG: hypothetical protein LKM44_03525 [Wolbachia endosymbiont of Meromenopon meropis]|nr:hypothetical protein [Wolbachia endosymbiont of Meromenopon meropis]
MSTSLIVSLAFFLGLIISYRSVKKIVKETLNKTHYKNKFINDEVEKFRRDVLEYYRESSEKYKRLDAEVNRIMNEALDKANSIISFNRQQLNQTLDRKVQSNLKKVTDQVERTIGDLHVNTANIAANTIKKIMQEHKDEKRNSEIISSLSRNLNKKLH